MHITINILMDITDAIEADSMIQVTQSSAT